MTSTCSRALRISPLRSGWALDAILELDYAKLGLLRFLHTASALRRQAVFLVLARLDWDRLDQQSRWMLPYDKHAVAPARSLAGALATMRVRDLISAVFGATPEGLMGILSRCGDDALEQFNYTLLHAICDDPKNRHRRKLLQHAPRIDDDLVDVVWRLPRALLRPEVLNHVRCAEDIERYASALNVLRRLHPGIADEDFALSLSQMAPGTDLSKWIRRWTERAPELPAALPFSGDRELRPLVSGRDVKETARRYQNCLRRRIGDVALGRACYYEHVDGAIAELRGLSQGRWLLEGIFGPQNKNVPPPVIHSIRAKLEGAGVLVPAALVQGPDEDALAEILGLYEFAASPSLSWDRGLVELECR